MGWTGSLGVLSWLEYCQPLPSTLDLPFIRTSVDYGTAFDLAGKGVADSLSMLEADPASGGVCAYVPEEAGGLRNYAQVIS
jgi:hypothetical protein